PYASADNLPVIALCQHWRRSRELFPVDFALTNRSANLRWDHQATGPARRFFSNILLPAAAAPTAGAAIPAAVLHQQQADKTINGAPEIRLPNDAYCEPARARCYGGRADS